MIVLVLRGINSTPVIEIIRSNGDFVIETCEKINVDFIIQKRIEFIVSHGYRHIIKPDIINLMIDRIVNLHISLLPWNRGADPNLWSFLEDTPKGVTLHLVDEGIDTGDIIAQKIVVFENEDEHTLSSTYSILQHEIINLFKETWNIIKLGKFLKIKQPHGGSFHRLHDKKSYEHLLTKGWDTLIKDIKGAAKDDADKKFQY